MAVIRPFRALRPDPAVVQNVASVPYDVVNRQEAFELAKDYPNSYLRITRAEIELPRDVDPYSDAVYTHAKENLARICKDAPLLIEEKPSFYLYKLVMGEQEQTGITATFSVDDYENDIIMKHEKTRKEKEDDRTRHIVTTEAQTGPVFLTYRGIKKVKDAAESIKNENEPLYSFTAPDGIVHTVWTVPEEYNQLIIDKIAATEKLYIADGHHRAASAARARNVKRSDNPGHTGSEEYNYFLAVLFPADELKILPYNRVVFDLNGLEREEFFERISEDFTVEATGQAEPKEKRTFGMYTGSQWYTLKAKESVSTGDSIGEGLDVSILQNYLLKPVLGIDDPRTSKRIDFIGGIRGTKELEKLVDSGDAIVAFSLYPVTVDDLMKISDAGEIMPPKSTWFEPKLRDGILVHKIVD